jgi:hypothetical protein
MDYRDTPEEILCSDVFLGHHGIRSTRRELLPLLGALPLTLSGTVALASQINPSETQIALPDVIRWSGWINGFPPHSGEMATYPGCMSAPATEPAVIALFGLAPVEFELIDQRKPTWRQV